MSIEAISPIDGRYHKTSKSLSNYFSESGLIKYRILVEIEYFIALCEKQISPLKELSSEQRNELKDIYISFSSQDALRVKEIERTTNHDVKAVEYFIKEKIKGTSLEEFSEFIHFGLTSQDINNTAIPLSLKEASNDVLIPAITNIASLLLQNSNDWRNISMMARTHGQPASPTTLGKEWFVFYERLTTQLKGLATLKYPAKFGGATGNLNAHFVAYPSLDWKEFANSFINETLGLNRQQTTTQIAHYDGLSTYFDQLKRINTILIDFSKDIWTYISMDYFKQRIKVGEIGSSAMPHKVNPIDFENAEGNLGMANAILNHLSEKLPVSRLQRDLTDSTVLRNIGVPLAHMLIALNSLNKGINKLLLNEQTIAKDLDNNWAVVAEAIQTILRREGYPKPYEALKELTRTNQEITKNSIHQFIDTLAVSEEIKDELKVITPSNYIGMAADCMA